MGIKGIYKKLLVCALVASCLCVDAGAASAKGNSTVASAEVVTIQGGQEMSGLRATGSFNIDIKPGAIVTGDPNFSLEAGEVVTIKAAYSPFDASVDFGLIAPDGLFHFVNVTDGIVDESIEVDERGSYILAIRNNSDETVNVSGYVNY